MVQRITLSPQGPEFSRFVMGYWRLMDWNMSPLQLAGFIEEHLDLGITTVDHADIYGGYQCEAAFTYRKLKNQSIPLSTPYAT